LEIKKSKKVKIIKNKIKKKKIKIKKKKDETKISIFKFKLMCNIILFGWYVFVYHSN